MSDKPSVCFVPVAMKLFWQLYPQLEGQTFELMDKVINKLQKDYKLYSCQLIGDIPEAEKLADEIKNRPFDLLIIWENGYVASGIPAVIIEKLKDVPVAILVTQRDKVVPEDMDYARYMDSTATTSAMELGGVLARMHISYESFIGHVDEENVYLRLAQYAKAAHTYAGLRNLKIGKIGYPYPGMLDICVDDAVVSSLGPKVEIITLSEVAEQLQAVTDEETFLFMEEVKKECDYSRITEEDFIRAARLYRALENIVHKKGLKALCVHDYECLSTVSKTVAEFALSYLENRYGIAAGVEGDMPNCISAFIARSFSKVSPMFVDWTMFDEEDNAIFLQHNGKADPAILLKPVLSPSAEPFGGVEGEGVVFEAAAKPGKVTMVSMIYRDSGWYLFAAEGEAIEKETKPCRLNQMTVKINSPVKEFLERICNHGIGHHLNVAYSHFITELRYLAKLSGINIIIEK